MRIITKSKRYGKKAYCTSCKQELKYCHCGGGGMIIRRAHGEPE